MLKRLIGNKMFLVTALLLIMAFPVVTGATILNAAAPDDGNFLHKKNANGIGAKAEKLGITSYNISEENGEKVVDYTGSNNGTIRWSYSDAKVLKAVNKGSEGTSSLTWDVPNGKVAYVNAKGETYAVSLNFETGKWSFDSGSEDIVKDSKDAKLMSAILIDFDPIGKYSYGKTDETVSSATGSGTKSGVCPTYSYHVHGYDAALDRSVVLQLTYNVQK